MDKNKTDKVAVLEVKSLVHIHFATPPPPKKNCHLVYFAHVILHSTPFVSSWVINKILRAEKFGSVKLACLNLNLA